MYRVGLKWSVRKVTLDILDMFPEVLAKILGHNTVRLCRVYKVNVPKTPVSPCSSSIFAHSLLPFWQLLYWNRWREVKLLSLKLKQVTRKADSHITCRVHAVHLPCRPAEGLECLSHLVYTVQACLFHTCHAAPMPCYVWIGLYSTLFSYSKGLCIVHIANKKWNCNGGPDVLTKYDFCDMTQNVGNYLPIGKASHRRRLESYSKIIIVNVYINF